MKKALYLWCLPLKTLKFPSNMEKYCREYQNGSQVVQVINICKSMRLYHSGEEPKVIENEMQYT